MTTTATARVELSDASATSVADAMRAMVKAFRAWQLYLPNNPTRARAVATARAAFSACWSEEVDRIVLTVREAEFLMRGRSVHRESERLSDGLPWILYRDGIRELTLLPGFETEGLEPLLRLFQRARQAAPDEDDLVTMLWVADFETVQYRYVDLAGAYELSNAAGTLTTADAGVDAPENASQPPIAAAAVDVPALSENPAPGLVRVEDFESTLFFLDRQELNALKAEVRTEFSTDPRRSVLALLFDIVELQRDLDARLEAIGWIEEVMVDLLASGTYDIAAYALVEANATVRRASELPNAARERLLAFTERLSEPGVVRQLLQAVDDGTRAPNPETLEALVAELRGSALAPLLSWLTHSAPGLAKQSVERAILKLAERHTTDLVRLLEADDDATAHGATQLSGQLRSAAAVPALGRILHHPRAVRRLEATHALAAVASPGALQLLDVAVHDVEQDVRVAALRAIAANRFVALLPKLTAAIRKKDIRNAERSEKTALFDAYGATCGDAGVALLDGMLNGRAFLGPRETPEVRACAARALGLVGTASAVVALRKASNASDAVVRHEVARALRAGGANG